MVATGNRDPFGKPRRGSQKGPDKRHDAMRSHFRGMLLRCVILVAAALVLVASLALALVPVPGISSLRALEAGPCGRATIFDCVSAPVAASEDAKLLVALPQTVMRSLRGSRQPRSPSVLTVSVEQQQRDPRRVMRTGLHAEQKHKMHTAGVPLLPDVLKPERLHSRPERTAVPGAPAVQKESAPTKQTGAGENRRTTGIVAGDRRSTEFAIAREIATALARGRSVGSSETALKVLPRVGDGGIQAITDVLTLPDADMAIVPVGLVDRFREATRSVDIRSKLIYIAPLFAEELHVLARVEISDIRDLDGKVVNFGEDGSAAAVLGREICADLGIHVREAHVDLRAATDGMRKREISALFLVSGKPVSALASLTRADGFHVLAIPSLPNLTQDFLPSVFTHKDYPYLVRSNERVDTIAVLSALISYNWPSKTKPFRLLELFAQTLFSHLPELQTAAHHPKWREVNLAATLPGWTRFHPTEGWTQRH
jgi:TRAP-type uncharacterized transport system substrate-binding protein